MPQEPHPPLHSCTPKKSPALGVALVWGACVAGTLGLMLVLIVLVRSEMLSWTRALSLAGAWSALAATLVMWIAVRAIHQLERETQRRG